MMLGQREFSMIDATSIIGWKIKKHELAFKMFLYEDVEKGYVAGGLSPDMSRFYIEMGKAF
jgi:hypothetical protein